MTPLEHLLTNNRDWAAKMKEGDPQFFERLTGQQVPEYLWIGCSDSRVPANQIIGLLPGQVFVHRNIANTVVHSDLNCLSVMQYAIDVLHVKHIIVCGHYGCNGVHAALHNQRLGLVDNWLRHIQDVVQKHQRFFTPEYTEEHWDRLCALNVIEQVSNVIQTTAVQAAWERGQQLTIHGWIYGLQDGLICNLGMEASSIKEAAENYAMALKMLETG